MVRVCVCVFVCVWSFYYSVVSQRKKHTSNVNYIHFLKVILKATLKNYLARNELEETHKETNGNGLAVLTWRVCVSTH